MKQLKLDLTKDIKKAKELVKETFDKVGIIEKERGFNYCIDPIILRYHNYNLKREVTECWLKVTFGSIYLDKECSKIENFDSRARSYSILKENMDEVLKKLENCPIQPMRDGDAYYEIFTYPQFYFDPNWYSYKHEMSCYINPNYPKGADVNHVFDDEGGQEVLTPRRN